MAESNHDHVLLTRFNLPSQGFESSVRSRRGWLESRVALFERYCLPSVTSQSDSDFSWIVYFDPASPVWLRKRIQQWEGSGHMTPIFRASVSDQQLVDDLRSVSGASGERLLTTNLDNDDGLASDFVARLRSVEVEGRATAIYLARGLITCNGRLYERTDKTNAFCSVSAPWAEAKTCWANWHNLLGKCMPVCTEYGGPAWLQVVHGRNVSNRVHGRLTAPSRYAWLFPGLLNDIPDPTIAEWMRDRTLGVPLRVVREAGRATVKEAIVAAAGRGALDTARRVIDRIAAVTGAGERGGEGV